MRDLRLSGLPMLHDSNPHITRAIAYHQALQDGQFPPMWASEVMGGIGSPVLMLNYQLPYMIGELWHLLGFSFFESYKLTLGLSFVVSGLLMYVALRTKMGWAAAWVGALIYTLAPYRFVDIFVRGALGESLAFVFPPLLIWGMSKASTPLLILGWTGLFLTHPIASAAFSIFFFGYCLIIKQKFDWVAYGVALLSASFNLLPTLFLTKYTYYSPALSDTLLMFPTLSQLFNSTWGYGVSLPGSGDGMSFEVGTVAWIVLIVGLYIAKKRRHVELGYLGVSVLVSLSLILPVSTPLYRLFLAQFVDFPWRLLMCIVFGTAWMGAHVITNLKWQISNATACVITAMLVLLSLPTAHTNDYWDKDISWFARETGDSYGEYAPRTRETRDSAPFGERAEFVEGHGSIALLSDRSNYKLFRVVSEQGGVARVNTAYFLGWNIPSNCWITTRTLTHIDDSGLIVCKVKPGESTLEINFKPPSVQRLGIMLTLAGIGMYLWILCRSFYLRITKRRRSPSTQSESHKS